MALDIALKRFLHSPLQYGHIQSGDRVCYLRKISQPGGFLIDPQSVEIAGSDQKPFRFFCTKTRGSSSGISFFEVDIKLGGIAGYPKLGIDPGYGFVMEALAQGVIPAPRSDYEFSNSPKEEFFELTDGSCLPRFLLTTSNSWIQCKPVKVEFSFDSPALTVETLVKNLDPRAFSFMKLFLFLTAAFSTACELENRGKPVNEPFLVDGFGKWKRVSMLTGQHAYGDFYNPFIEAVSKV